MVSAVLLHDGQTASDKVVYCTTHNIRNSKEIIEMQVNKNCGRLDQFLRVGMGLGLMYLGFVDTTLIGDTVMAIFVGIFGAINVLAGLSGFCPVYHLANISTRSVKHEVASHPLDD